MQKQFFVSHDGSNVGPFSIEEIVNKVQENTILMTDYIFDEGKQDWVLLMENSQFAELMKKAKPKAPPKMMEPKTVIRPGMGSPVSPKFEKAEATQTHAIETSTDDEWFVLKWDNRYGPFTYLEMVKMLQEKTVFEFDYAWKKGVETWVRIAEVSAFSAEKIRSFKNQTSSEDSKDASDVFFRRRHLRTEFNGSIVIHDNKKVWKGKSLEISEGGAGIIMYNALVLPGQKLYLHFKPGDKVPPFNAVVEVISKKFVKGVKDPEAPMSYGVRFMEINKGAQKAIQDYVARKAA